MESDTKSEVKAESEERSEQKKVARLLFKEKVVEEMEIEMIPTRITIPSIAYIEDPTNFSLKFYNLVFYISNVKTEDSKTVVEYRFNGVEEVRSSQ